MVPGRLSGDGEQSGLVPTVQSKEQRVHTATLVLSPFSALKMPRLFCLGKGTSSSGWGFLPQLM